MAAVTEEVGTSIDSNYDLACPPGAVRSTTSRLSTGYGRRFQRCDTITRVIIFGCMGMALFGYDTGVVSGAMVLLCEDLGLDTEQKEQVVSITMVFAAVGTVFGIPLNSIFGRKPLVMVSAVLYVAGSFCIALASGMTALLIGRSLLGVAIGFASGTVPMYSAEMSPPHMRGIVVTLNDLNIVVGQLIAALMNVAFKHVAGGWRWSMGIAAGPGALLFIGFLFLPESPRWLAMKGRQAEAEDVLEMLMDKELVGPALSEIMTSMEKEAGAAERGEGFAALVRRGAKKLHLIWTTAEVRRAAILGLGLMAMNQLSGINTVMYYSTTILVNIGFSLDAAIWLAALCCLAQLCGVAISCMSMDSIGRRATALRSCAGVIVTLLVLSTSFWIPGKIWDYVKVVALMSYLVAFGSGLSGVPWVVNAEIYPLRLRSAAVGQATVANWGFNWFVGRYFLTLCEAVGTGGAFSVFAGFSVVGGLWLYCMLPETMGLTLEAITDLFRRPGQAGKHVEADSEETSSTESEA